MADIRNIIKIFKYLTGSIWGISVLILLGILLVWTISEVLFLSGDKVYSDYLSYNKPLTFESSVPGERFRVVIQSRSKKAKKRIKHIITGPDGKLVIEDKDGYRKRTRAFYFNAETIGKYTLKIDDYYNPGGEDLPAEAAKYLNAKWVDIYKSDQTRILGTLENFIVLW
ncbi:hypothetical protein ACFL1N_06675 [Thermodesulfobacteriota bacterium]